MPQTGGGFALQRRLQAGADATPSLPPSPGQAPAVGASASLPSPLSPALQRRLATESRAIASAIIGPHCASQSHADRTAERALPLPSLISKARPLGGLAM